MEFRYNREKAELLRVMKSKGEKKHIKVQESGEKLYISLLPGRFANGEDAVPVSFQGKLRETSKGCTLKGSFNYGFNLTVLVIIAAVLIVARFIWSASQKQVDNMILCGIVAVLLGGVAIVVNVKAKPANKMIKDFLGNLNVR